MSREKPHVLFSFEKWCDFVPTCGPSSSWENFAAPLKATGLATFEVIHPDEYIAQTGHGIDSYLLERCLITRPDLLFILWYPDTHDYLNFQLDTLITIRRDLKIPVAAFWGDSQVPYWQPIVNRIVPCVDIVVDGNSPNSATPYGDKHFHITHPKDPLVYFNPGKPRDIDISFPGSVENRPKRLETLRYLESRGIQVFRTGGQREQFIDSRKYAEVFQRSKIALGINDHGGQTIVGRTIESTLCGALLLENAGMATTNWLRPGHEYVAYENLEDLEQKVRHFLTHEDERAAIAQRGCARATHFFNGTYFWQTLLQRARAGAPRIEAEALFRRNAALSAQTASISQICRCYEALALDPRHSKTLVKLAELNYGAGFLDQARSVLNRALEVDATCVDAFPILIRILRRCGDHAGAAQAAKQAEVLFVGEIEPFKLLVCGEIKILAGDLMQGVEFFNAYLRRNPEDYAAAVRLSGVLAEVGQAATCRQILEALSALPRVDASLLSSMAGVYESIGDSARGREIRSRLSSPV